jgi:hypothetical protein
LNLADIIIPILKNFFRGPIEKLVSDQIRSFPNKFNQRVRDTNGFFNLGKELPKDFPPSSPFSTLTLDYSLDDDFRIFKDRMIFGINGTFFNNDKPYRVPNIK